MRVLWLQLRDVPGGFGITARDWQDAMYLLAEARQVLKGRPIEEPMIESWTDVRSIDELDQDHVVPNMGTMLHRGVWFPNLPYVQ
ncbi:MULTISPECIES: hypothetical protein [Bradyrhizobium]|jgi:hypothetical protein|uniref:hypothetical protein n=1 Tax=Bradyrhizobium TaxID=374 RepID=UPI001074E62F|nr:MULTISPECIES: hypothetical protein [Bradyrhizobium]TFW61771.1 hypothetical protein CT676_05980 [Bradyrhizobium sp. MOS001]